LADSDLWLSETFTKGQAWVDLILLANHEQHLLNIRGNDVVIERGQVGWSEDALAKRWRWSRSRVTRFKQWLKRYNRIDIRNNNVLGVITILNYNDYQQNEPQNEQQTIQQTSRRQYTNNNEDNENKTQPEKKEAFDQSIKDNKKNTPTHTDHNENIDVAKSDHTEIINNVKVKLPKCKNCGHCSFCSLTPCTEQELYDLAMKMNLNLKDVKFKHQQIIDMLEDGSFRKKYKKHKTVFNTLRTWLKMSLERGYIHEMSEIERMCLQSDSPEMKERMKKAFYKLEHGETPWTLKNS